MCRLCPSSGVCALFGTAIACHAHFNATISITFFSLSGTQALQMSNGRSNGKAYTCFTLTPYS